MDSRVTCFAAVIIVTRLVSRKMRSGALFTEDWIMLLSMIPLFIRMGLIHVVLIFGTNNVNTVDYSLTPIEIQNRETGARLVLAARIFYAMFIWVSKLTVSEFLKRITFRIWKRSYEVTLQCIRIFLCLTFIAVVVGTLSDCQPFSHYWQVVPDPGPHCRLGYANLLAMGICDIITDILLIVFPIPIVLRSGQSWKRKLQLVLLFGLSIIMVGITATRIPKVISHRGRQQYRTVWASSEILASTAVSNAVILGSFLRDKGTKKNKFRSQSTSDSIDRVPTRRPTAVALQRVGSDEELFRYLGCRVPAHLLDEPDNVARPAPVAPSAEKMRKRNDSGHALESLRVDTANAEMTGAIQDSPRIEIEEGHLSPVVSTKRSMSFFDVGGLLEDGAPSWDSRSRSTTLAESGALGTSVQDFATPSPPQSRRGSRAFMSDLGALPPPTLSRTNSNGYTKRSHDNLPNGHRPRAHPPTGVLGPMIERQESPQSLQDAGGLLEALEEGPDYHGEEPAAPRLQARREREGSGMELQDVGGLLGEEHLPDASAAALQRTVERGSQATNIARRSESARRQALDEVDLEDVGGLLKE